MCFRAHRELLAHSGGETPFFKPRSFNIERGSSILYKKIQCTTKTLAFVCEAFGVYESVDGK